MDFDRIANAKVVAHGHLTKEMTVEEVKAPTAATLYTASGETVIERVKRMATSTDCDPLGDLQFLAACVLLLMQQVEGLQNQLAVTEECP